MTIQMPTDIAVAARPGSALTDRLLDDMLALLRQGDVAAMVSALTGVLHMLRADAASWPQTIAQLRRHPLFQQLMADPYLARCVNKPRGYAGDAVLIDMIYDRHVPDGTCDQGATLFRFTTAAIPSAAVARRRHAGRDLLLDAHRQGQRICVLACGHFREGDELAGEDIANITLVDQDALSLDVVRQRHAGGGALFEAANVFAFLRRAGLAGERYDLVYTLGLTDYLDDRAMTLLHRLLARVVAPGGRAVIANFRADLFFTGWMEAVMDWWLIYREAAELGEFGAAAGFASRTWTDATGCIVWAEQALPR
jgi:SAM-dependent methyltransferase